jgi:hypothetical protein
LDVRPEGVGRHRSVVELVAVDAHGESKIHQKKLEIAASFATVEGPSG